MQKEGQVRIPSGCAIVGAIDRAGGPICGEELIRAIAVMHDRSNGLGGGFAGYGIYPQYKELYAFHLFYEDSSAKEACERFLERHFDIVNLSKIPTRPHPRVTDAPLIWRYFMAPLPNKLEQSQLDEREYVRRCVTRVNTQMKGAHVLSSGKNMGVFKAVGYPEDVGEFYRLEEYEGYAWTAHGRYPTNTPGCGGAPTPSPCWTTRWCTTGRSPPMTPTGASLRCSATAAPFSPIRRSSPTSSTIWCGSRGSPWRRPPM